MADPIHRPVPLERSAKEPTLGALVEALSARVALLEGESSSLHAKMSALALEADAVFAATKSRLGQIRNVEQRCRKYYEAARNLHTEVMAALGKPS